MANIRNHSETILFNLTSSEIISLSKELIKTIYLAISFGSINTSKFLFCTNFPIFVFTPLGDMQKVLMLYFLNSSCKDRVKPKRACF